MLTIATIFSAVALLGYAGIVLFYTANARLDQGHPCDTYY